ncbi:MAG: cupin domain-containing protein [Bacteroidales bacterium]|jgi:quercetin dioxygenase-like cupin family protein|nr:cupin domain-containing protein [Bacteroidales bacterium]
MTIRNLSNSPKVPFDLEGYILHSEKQIELIHLLLKPGEALAEHKNTFNVIFFVAEGYGTLSIEGKDYLLKATDVTKVTSEKMRGWKNTSNQDLRLLVIKLL